MKKVIFGFVLGIIAFAGIGYAITVNPASQVTADSAATPLTIPYRDATGAFAMISGAIDTAKIASGAIDTSKLLGTPNSLANGAVLCAKGDGNKSIGVCSGVVGAGGTCTCI